MGRRAARRRAELGLTLEDLAVKTGIDPGYLEYFEKQRGRPPERRLDPALGPSSRHDAGGPGGTGRVVSGTWACGTSPTAPVAHTRAV